MPSKRNGNLIHWNESLEDFKQGRGIFTFMLQKRTVVWVERSGIKGQESRSLLPEQPDHGHSWGISASSNELDGVTVLDLPVCKVATISQAPTLEL